MHKRGKTLTRKREDEGRAEEESSCKTVGLYKLNLKRINAELQTNKRERFRPPSRTTEEKAKRKKRERISVGN